MNFPPRQKQDHRTATVHFNCEGKENNITSNGNEYNYIVLSYGSSQKILDGIINPPNPELVNQATIQYFYS